MGYAREAWNKVAQSQDIVTRSHERMDRASV